MESNTTNAMFTWVDLATTDTNLMKGFYGELMGWSFKETNFAKGKYTLAMKDNTPACGIFEMETKGTVPPHWMSYISTDSLDQTMNKAKTLGASVRKGPIDIADKGRMAILLDSVGAYIALWQGNQKSEKSAMKNQPGFFCWPELMTSEPKKAEQFYTKLFSWTAKQDDHMPDYTIFYKEAAMVGGMMQTKEKMLPNWLTYFAVDDCDKRTVQAQKFKGKVVVPPQDIPKVGRFSVVEDPLGASFAMIKLTM